MSYDGPSFYKKRENNQWEESKQEIVTPRDRLKEEEKRRSQLNKEFIKNQEKRNESRPANYYFRSTQVPKSLQNREGWKKDTWNQSLIRELQKRLQKEPTDYLLFSDNLDEAVSVEDRAKNKEKRVDETLKEESAEKSAEAMRIKQMVAEIESTLDTAALVQKEIKPDLTKPNTGLHRTLSNIIAKDQNEFKE